jgi:signal transduction histidine kinase
MASNLSTFFNILANPPGDLIFHLVVSSTLILMGVLALLSLKKTSAQNQARRTLIGCSILLFLQLILVSLRIISIFLPLENTLFYPLVERLTATLTIIWLIWAFFDDQQRFLPTRLIIFLTLTLVIMAGVSMAMVPHLSGSSRFNLVSLDLLWQFLAIALVLAGLALALFNPIPQQVVMMLILLLLAVGHLLQIFLQNQMGLEMGAVRFAQTLGLPWLMVLIQRLSTSTSSQSTIATGTAETFTEILVDTKPALMNLLLKINLTHTSEDKFRAVVQALSLSVVADICYLVRIPAEGDKLEIITGYDLIRETYQQPDTLAKEDLPRIMEAWRIHQSLELCGDHSEVRDAVTLGLLIKYYSVGNLFAYPLGLPDQPTFGGLIFLSPYTGKCLGDKTRRLMDEIKDTLTQVLFMPDPQEKARHALNQAHLQLNILTDEVEKLHHALIEKEAEIREKEILIKGLKGKYQIEKMETVKSIDQLKAHITQLTTQLNSQQIAHPQMEQLQQEIRQLTGEREKLNLALSRANAMIKDLQTQTGQTGPIRLSLDNQIISLDSIAANVKLRVNPQLQQKQIDLEIHNPDGRQMIKTDPELLQTALVELLKNAILASEPGGSIQLDQKLSFEMGMLTIQVTDYGEGLTQMEQTALFSAQHETIPGVGDVRALRNAIRAIRVLTGKIWLKSKKASYTTFRCQIPVRIID